MKLHHLRHLWPLLSNRLSLVFPRHCLFCLEKTYSHSDLCHYCAATLSLNSPCCLHCAEPLEQNSPQCGHCLSHTSHYDQVFSPYQYSAEMAYLIKQFKYQQKIYYARTLSELFIARSYQSSYFSLPQLLIPIPMHYQRLRQRGYNQAVELTRLLASHYDLPFDYLSFIRQRHTRLQAEMTARKRQKNVRNAFALKTAIRYSHIALVDDVMTTGSTVNEAARTLKAAGIKKVDVWTIARAGLRK